ncbi:P-loop containing nucleoside triphosphate hydrolase protein [Hypomontagnella monticulosa]|nr:P-loop containing nucleoside triphosphate hydrolase protein [Hypomontagnella monticulosa]
MDALNQLIKKEPMGSNSAVGKLYRHTKASSWSVIQDPVMHQKEVSGMGQSYAIVHRFSMEQLPAGHAWTTHSVSAQSPGLQRVLAQIFQGYPDWAPADKPFTFLPPYKPVIHRWEEINEFDAGPEKTNKEMDMLRDELKPLVDVNLHLLKEVKSTGVISFNGLWLIFAPGDYLVANLPGGTCICRLISATKIVKPKPGPRPPRRHFPGRMMINPDDSSDDDDEDDRESYWAITYSQVDWNGSYCGQKTGQGIIRQFNGMRAVTDLSFYPLSFSKTQEEKELALARGRKFESLRGFHVMECKGAKFVEKGMGLVAEPVSGRVIVDAYAFYHCQEVVPPTLHQSITPETDSEEGSDDDVEESTLGDDDRHEDLRPMTDEECILAVPRVKGFDLRTKQWCQLNVDDLRETTWTDISYDNLVLPAGEKELLMGFAGKDRLRDTGFDDFVKNKGKGIIILLYGPAGVGKTLTAEAVAEKSRVPLYVLSAGELGSKAERLEGALQTALKCCQLWGAMLLLDEADVFLEARGSDNVERNELVSIFLRQLEYYQGLMFLTTNRVRKLDNAFLSRIDLILPYNNLDVKTRRELWVKFVNRLPSSNVDLSDHDLDDLATNEMNGREIKSVLKTALIIAAGSKPLRKHHLQTVLDIRKRVESLRLGTDGMAN